ncbi:hypothetical protein [Streptomyces shenzhenensis]|uniref:hypothetical protein n=1 Tax=Streptomyces shenzhenensis TaxID=943815 RepID=UPI00369A0BAC
MPDNTDSGDAANPDYGKDLGYLPPQRVFRTWDTVPTYNLPQRLGVSPLAGGGGEGKDDGGRSSAINVHLGELRSAETTLFTRAGERADGYMTLRAQVFAVKDTVFGQQATKRNEGGPAMAAGEGGGFDPSLGQMEPTKFQGEARKFANAINPAQEKALLQLANALTLVGKFTAALGHAGRYYATIDTSAHFPDPPAYVK